MVDMDGGRQWHKRSSRKEGIKYKYQLKHEVYHAEEQLQHKLILIEYTVNVCSYLGQGVSVLKSFHIYAGTGVLMLICYVSDIMFMLLNMLSERGT